MSTPLAEALRGARHQPGPKILTIDIERLPGEAEVFDARVDYIRPSQWKFPPRTICFAARWYGRKAPIFEAEWKDPAEMIARSWQLYDEADAVVTFNGIRFDNKHLRAMWFEAGLPMPRPWKNVDLFPVVKQFGYVSSSLDYVTKKLGHPGKVDKYDVEVAKAAVAGDVKMQRKLRRYNIGDIETTEWLYDRLRGWIPGHPYLGDAMAGAACNQCSSTNLELQDTAYRAVRIDYELYRCTDCGANVKGGWVARATTTGGAR